MRLLVVGAALFAVALTACGGGSASVPKPSSNRTLPPAPRGAVPKPTHSHIVNPPILSANLSTPVSALLSQAGIAKISGGFAARFGAIVISSNLTTYGQFLASVHRNYRSGYIDNNRQVWVVTYGFPSGFTTRAGVIAPGGQGIFAYDAVDGRSVARTYSGSYSFLLIHGRRVAVTRVRFPSMHS